MSVDFIVKEFRDYESVLRHRGFEPEQILKVASMFVFQNDIELICDEVFGEFERVDFEYDSNRGMLFWLNSSSTIECFGEPLIDNNSSSILKAVLDLTLLYGGMNLLGHLCQYFSQELENGNRAMGEFINMFYDCEQVAICKVSIGS